MKNNGKLLVGMLVLVIIFFGALFFIFCNTAFFKDPNNTNLFSTLSSVSNIIMSVASIVNIYFIIGFYFNDKELKREEERISYKLYWFRTFILEKNIDMIESFFKRNIQIIDEYKDLENGKAELNAVEYSRLLKEKFGTYTDEKIKITHAFTDMVLATDKAMGLNIARLFEEFQNEYTTYLSNLSSGMNNHDFSKFKNLVYSQKVKLLGILYSYGVSNFINN